VSTTVERITALRAASVFRGLSLEQLRAVADLVVERSAAPGERIFDEGAPSDGLYVLESGRVAVERAGVRLGELEAPTCFGEMSLLGDAPRSATVVALTTVTLLQLDPEAARALVRLQPDVACRLIEVLSARLREADEALARGAPAAQPSA
jgi:CRP/FNR family transcriptional regulator, cyclic AMP receptor protein